MVQEASGTGSMLKLGPNCDAKSKGIQTKQRSDAIKNCVKLFALVAILVLVLQYGAQQLQASNVPAESVDKQQHNQQSCCLEHAVSNVGNGTQLIINSIDRHDRGFNDGPLVTNGHTFIEGKVEQRKEQSLQDETTIGPKNRADGAIEFREDSGDKTVGKDADLDLATMASNGIVILPKIIQNRITLDQLATLHENFDRFVENPTIQHPKPQIDQLVDQLSGSINTLLADAQDTATKRQNDDAASVNQPYSAEPIVAGSNAGLTEDLLAAQATNNYGQQDPSGEDNDDDDSSPDFNEPAGDGQNQDRADFDEDNNTSNNNAVAQQHQLNPAMEPLNGATNVYEGNTPRHVDVGSSLSQEQSNESPNNNNDDGPVMSAEQMPDSIESLMRSGGETGPLDTEGSAEDPSAADEPGDPNPQLAAGGNNYAQNVELPGVTPQAMSLAGNAAAYLVPASLPGVANIGVAPAQGVRSDDDDDDLDNDDDDGDNKNNGIASSMAPAALNQQVSFPDNRLPTQLSSPDQQLMTDSSYNGPTHDYLQTAAGHHYKKKKKKKVKKVKKIKIVKIKKKKKKKYKVVKYKKKKKGKKSMDHGKYYMYAKVPKKKSWEFGFKKGNKKHWISRHEKGHKNKFKTKVKWYDKKSKGKGVHIWDYNHHDKKKKKHYG